MYKTVNSAADIQRPGCVLSDAPELDNVVQAQIFSSKHPEFDIYFVKGLGHCVIVKERAVFVYPERQRV